jgi:hypothetical protein
VINQITRKVITQIHRVTELGTGKFYWKDGQWQESREVIIPALGGTVALEGQHQVFFSLNLNTLGGIRYTAATNRSAVISHI